MESLTPSGAVFCLRLPGADIDLELFESGFQRIFIPLFLASDFPLAIPQLPVEDLFRKSVVRHPHNMTCPSCLGPEKHGMYRLGAGLLKDFSVGYFVLPLDVEEFAQAAHMEVVELSGMTSVHCPFSTAVE